MAERRDQVQKTVVLIADGFVAMKAVLLRAKPVRVQVGREQKGRDDCGAVQGVGGQFVVEHPAAVENDGGDKNLVYAGGVRRRVVVVDERREREHEKQKRIQKMFFVERSCHVGQKHKGGIK